MILKLFQGYNIQIGTKGIAQRTGVQASHAGSLFLPWHYMVLGIQLDVYNLNKEELDN